MKTIDINCHISELVEKAINGNDDSLEHLVNLFQKDIFHMVYYRTSSHVDAEDLTQDIFIKMIKSLPKLKEINRFRPWLFRIALNCVRDFHRKKYFLDFFSSTNEEDKEKEGIEKDIFDNSSNPERLLMQKEFWSQFNRFKDNLSKWEKEVFMLRFIDNLGIREIAEILNKSESSIKTHLYRAIKKFKQDSVFQELLKGSI